MLGCHYPRHGVIVGDKLHGRPGIASGLRNGHSAYNGNAASRRLKFRGKDVRLPHGVEQDVVGLGY